MYHIQRLPFDHFELNGGHIIFCHFKPLKGIFYLGKHKMVIQPPHPYRKVCLPAFPQNSSKKGSTFMKMDLVYLTCLKHSCFTDMEFTSTQEFHSHGDLDASTDVDGLQGASKEDFIMYGDPSQIELMFQVVVYIIGIAGFLVNLFVLLILLTSSNIRSRSSYMLLIHQAAADLYMSFSILVSYVIWYHGGGIKVKSGLLGKLHCKLITSEFILRIGYVASTLNIVLMAAERLLMVAFPIMHRNTVSKRKLAILMVGSWLFAILVNFPLITATYIQNNICMPGYAFNSLKFHSIFGYFKIALTFFFPMFFVIFAYSYMFKFLWQRQKPSKRNQVQNIPVDTMSVPMSSNRVGLTQPQGHSQKNHLKKSQINIMKVMASIGVVFILTWTPIRMYTFLYSLGLPLTYQDTYYFASMCLAILNPIINPLIYVVKCVDFKTRVKKVLWKNLETGITTKYTM